MLRNKQSVERLVSGLRTRFVPRCRVGHGFISLAPWFNLFLLIMFFLLIENKFVLTPGYTVELPAESGPVLASRSRHVVVVMSIPDPGMADRNEVVYFRDDRFFTQDEGRMAILMKAFEDCAGTESGSELLIHADYRVRHGTVVRLLSMARQAGFRRADIATRALSDAVVPVRQE